MKNLKKGVLIVFEGIDGAGKTTQAKLLLHTLQKRGLDSVYFREPSESKWGKEIKKKAAFQGSLSPQQELDLFQKDRKENVEKNIKPALKNKKVVLMDRYYFSTIAYQGAKGIDPQYIQEFNQKIAVKPDLVFILDIKASRGLQRLTDRKRKDLLFEKEDYLVEVRKMFKRFKGENFIHLQAGKKKKEIQEEIEKIVLDYLEKFKNYN